VEHQAPGRAAAPVDTPDPAPTDHFGGVATVTVVVPALNEAENLPHVLPLIPEWVHEVILVDDHCTDDTVSVAKTLLPRIKVVANTRKRAAGRVLWLRPRRPR
jgi:cellulose synthase/poly-beta-1,6-N-acetylglucosamine synthase-like glycosyltransferase